MVNSDFLPSYASRPVLYTMPALKEKLIVNPP